MASTRDNSYSPGQVIKGFELIERKPKHHWVVKCLLCGKVPIKSISNILKKKFDYCECNKMHVDIASLRFGKLTALYRVGVVRVGKNKEPKSLWKCVCDCGKEVEVTLSNLKSGVTTSCGCSRVKYTTNEELRAYHKGTVIRTRLRGYARWVKDVAAEYDSMCVIHGCGSTERVQAHHVIEWSYIRFRPNIRLHTGMGRPLCVTCHRDYHSLCGNTKLSHAQFLAYEILHKTIVGFRTLPKQERKLMMDNLEKTIADLFERLLSLEEDKKALSDEIKESIKTFAENNDLEPEALTEGLSKYKKYLKDPAKFVLVDYSIDKVLHSFVKEYQDKQTALDTTED